MPEDPPESYVAWEGQETYHFTKASKNALARSSVVALLCRPGEMAGEAITELCSLIEVAVFNCPKLHNPEDHYGALYLQGPCTSIHLYDILEKQNYRNREQISGCQGLGERQGVGLDYKGAAHENSEG